MKITYDKEADAMYIYLNDNKVQDSEGHKPGFIVDYDKDGGIVGIEMLDASKRMTNPTKVEYEIA